MVQEDVAIVIMAGGQGKRFTNGIKVLQNINGIPMLVYLVHTALKLNPKKIIIVVGIYKIEIIKTLSNYISDMSKIKFVDQLEPKGTGHALQCCIPELTNIGGLQMTKILILSGDTPMIQLSTMYTFIHSMKSTSDVIVMVRNTDNPKGYGRIVTIGDEFYRIIEDKDASPEEKMITLVNSGIYCVRSHLLIKNLPLLNNNNSQNEYYLTDVIRLIKDNDQSDITLYEIPQEREYEVMGVNTQEDLNILIKSMQV